MCFQPQEGLKELTRSGRAQAFGVELILTAGFIQADAAEDFQPLKEISGDYGTSDSMA